MARVLIAGCGDVGAALGLKLAADGHQVWALRRHPERLPPLLQPVAADLADPATLTILPPALDYVFYTAAADGFSETAYRAAYVDGIAHLLTALQQAGQQPHRLIFTSSTSVYAQHDGEWVDEDSPAQAEHFSGRLMREGEKRLWQGPYPATVLRLGGIYGPGRTRLLDTLRRANPTCRAGLYTNRVHRDDAAAALHHLMRLPQPASLYLGVDDQPALQCEELRWLAAQLGIPEPVVVTDGGGGRRQGNKRCRNTRLRASGFIFRYPGYQEGYAALLQGGVAD